jgi:hypothetical protein
MKMKKKLASSVFLSGKIVERGIYFLSSRLDILPEGEYTHCRISAYKDGEFFYQDRSMQVESVCIRRETPEEPLRASCVLPRFNSIVGFHQRGGDMYDEDLPNLPDGGGGVMNQLRLIDGKLYAVGSGGCIFRRIRKGQWEILNKGLDTRDFQHYKQQGFSFSEALAMAGRNETETNCINGANSRIFSAGDRGEIFFLKRDEWTRVQSNTNAILCDIQLDYAGLVYVCGWKGTLLKGDENGFTVIPTNIDDNLKTMTFFNGLLYVGGSKGLYKLEDEILHPVITSQNEQFNCVELDAYDGQLLLVSDRWFQVFDGKSWIRIDDPDNAEILKKERSSKSR